MMKKPRPEDYISGYLPELYRSVAFLANCYQDQYTENMSEDEEVQISSNIILPIGTLAKFVDAKSLMPLDFDVKRQKDSILVDVKSGQTSIHYVSTLTFPDYRQITNNNSDEKANHVRLNYKYVKSAVEAVAAVSQKGDHNVDIFLGDGFGVVEFKKMKQTNKGGNEIALIPGVTDIACYIMPVRQ